MAQVAVGESIRAALEPHNDGMQLTHGADYGVMDAVVDDLGRNDEVARRIDAV